MYISDRKGISKVTILGGDYKPIEVETLDLVGYKGDGVFVILNPVRGLGRKLPDEGAVQGLPLCLRAAVTNNQVVNFSGEVATLHDIDGVWHYKYRRRGSQPIELQSHRFFEIGDSE